MEDRLIEEIARASRHRQLVSLLSIDLDGLKEINDLNGHEAGDIALRAVADSLRKGCRISDVATRRIRSTGTAHRGIQSADLGGANSNRAQGALCRSTALGVDRSHQ